MGFRRDTRLCPHGGARAVFPRVQDDPSQLLSDCKWTSGHGRGPGEEPSGASHKLEGHVRSGGMGGGCDKGHPKHNALPKVWSL